MPAVESCSAHALLRLARRELDAAGVEEPLLAARVLLAHALGMDRAELLRRGDLRVAPEAADRFLELVAEKARRVPLAYLVGIREFYGRSFEVTPAVLVPRPETELLVELAIEFAVSGGVALDVGTGSGCIAVSVAAEGWGRVVGIDCSGEALQVARRNALRHGVAERVQFLRGDLLGAVANRSADLALANLPYIPTAELETLAPEVRDHEPRAALDGGADGLDPYRRLLHQGRRVLRRGGRLAVEVGAGQAGAVRDLLAALGYGATETRRDLAGIERVVTGVWRG